MADPHGLGLEEELRKAFDGLHEAVARATEASNALDALATRVHAISDVFDQIEAAVREGRRQIAGASATLSPPSPAITRPTLVVPEAPAATEPETFTFAAPEPEPAIGTSELPRASEPAAVQDFGAATETRETEPEAPPRSERREELLSFRLEFESRPGPLDLRAVDDAISEHPGVRDIALLDYDGHRATLKVWVAGGMSPIEIQQAIREQVARLFPPGNDISVIALEDAA